MKNICSAVFVIFFSFNSFSQSFFRGKVVDVLSRQPLIAACVLEENGDGKALTDEYGMFSLKAKNNKPTLHISNIGYEPQVIATDTNQLQIELEPNALTLSGITLQNYHSAKSSSIAKVDLALKPVRSTQELLSIVPGLFIAQHAGGGKAEQIFLRGFDADHGTDVQVNLDGIPVNMVSHAHGQGYADAHFIIPETINNIDFGAGPYYTQQGNFNTAGYVNFSTYKNIDRSRVQIEAGNFNTYRTLVMADLLKKNKEQQSAYIASEFYYTNGPTIDKQNLNRLNFFGKYNLAISPSSQLSATVSSFNSKWNASGQVPQRAVEKELIDRFGSLDPSEGGYTQRRNASISLDHRFNNGAHWENSVYYSRYIFNLYSNFTFFLNDPVNGDAINQAEKRHMAGYSSKLSNQYFFTGGSLQSTYGAGIRHDAIADNKLANVVQRRFLNYTKLGDIRETNSFAFMQQQLNKGRWLVDAGLRLDYLHFSYFDKLSNFQLPSQDKSILSPKFNIQYTITKKAQIYFKTGKGFHSNDTRVVVAQAGQQILPAAYGADIGFILKPTSNLYINAAVWWLYLDQEFVYVGDDGNVEPSGKTIRKGIDLLIRYQFSPVLFANINLNVTKPRARGAAKGENYIPLAPVATSTGGLFYKQKTGFNGGISYRYIKSRPANEDNSIIAKGYFLLDGSLNYTRHKYEVGIAVENILNVDWNEAQFATESKLKDEPAVVTELNFTPGLPLFARIKLAYNF